VLFRPRSVSGKAASASGDRGGRFLLAPVITCDLHGSIRTWDIDALNDELRELGLE
jgi:hypothetical protein